jgi:uncharacterized membrane protein YebE (DUF533 family)
MERAIVAFTSLALNCPSTFTIAWSKEQHKEELPVLYAGIGTSLLTVLGALLGKKWHGTEIMWGGLAATMGLFTYVVFCYKPQNVTNGASQVQPPLIVSAPNGSAGFTHMLMV